MAPAWLQIAGLAPAYGLRKKNDRNLQSKWNPAGVM